MNGKKQLARFFLLFCAMMVFIPILVIAAAIGDFDAEIWEFLLEYQLGILLKNTLLLAIGVGIGVGFLGTTTAWLLCMYRFSGSGILSWAMMLPLAVPAYVLAFVQVGAFEYTAPLATYFRENFGIQISNMRHGFGLTLVMSLTFYPYVYLLAKNAFSTMGNRSLEVGASLGLSPLQSFVKIALPMARPWIAGGIMLALMEVLADFGTVSIFGYDTFTTAIYDAWFGFFSLETAKQLAMMLIVFVFVLVAAEQISRGKRRFDGAGRGNIHRPKTLTGLNNFLALLYCLVILSLAFLLPIVQLLVWTVQLWHTHSIEWIELYQQIKNSFVVSLLAALTVATLSLLLALCVRTDKSKIALFLSKVATLGYAIPGTVLAVGVFVPVAYLDNVLIALFDLDSDTIFKGTLFVMIVAFAIRFLALGLSSVASGMERIRQSHTEAALSLGSVGIQNIWRIYLPLLKGAIGVAMLMTFVDVMKEMPITLMMRPYDFDMLSSRIYTFTTEGIFDKAALPALIIVLVGIIPVILFSKIGQKG